MQDPTGHHILLYDGVCGLCNRMNSFVLRHDKHSEFLYASLQSDMAKQVLSNYGKDPSALDTVCCVINYKTANERLLTKSEAAIFITRRLSFPCNLLALFRIVPLPLRDAVYDWIADHRYKMFGKFETCPVPKLEWRERFIETAGDDASLV